MNKDFAKIFIVTAVLVAFSGAWLTFLILVRTTEGQSVALQTKTAEESYQNENVISFGSLIQDTSSERAELFGFFASSTDVASVVESVENKGKALSVPVSVDSINVLSQPSTPTLSELDMKITGSGSFGNLVAFVGSIERMKQVFSLKDVSFFKNTSDPKTPWSIDADLVSYVSN